MLNHHEKEKQDSPGNSISDWLISCLESVESGSGKGVRLLFAIAGILATIAIWIFHLNHPSFIFSPGGKFPRILTVFLLVPPFLAFMSLFYLLFPNADSRNTTVKGPLFGYVQREKNNRRRNILVMAGLVSAVNFLLIMLSSSIH